jgi:hypothetical protein
VRGSAPLFLGRPLFLAVLGNDFVDRLLGEDRLAFAFAQDLEVALGPLPRSFRSLDFGSSVI